MVFMVFMSLRNGILVMLSVSSVMIMVVLVKIMVVLDVLVVSLIDFWMGMLVSSCLWCWFMMKSE